MRPRRPPKINDNGKYKKKRHNAIIRPFMEANVKHEKKYFMEMHQNPGKKLSHKFPHTPMHTFIVQ
jgi:hypothetical protein